MSNTITGKMKNRYSLLVFFFILAIHAFCQSPDTIVGKVIETAAPCLTDPCDPATIFAVQNDTATIVLSVNSSWVLVENYLVSGTDTIHSGDSVTVAGTVSTKQDFQNANYFEMEADTLILLPETPAKPKYTPYYHFFSDTTKMWWVSGNIPYAVGIGKDSIVNGTTYHIVGKALLENGIPQGDKIGVWYLLREDTLEKRVYRWNPWKNNEDLLYDFSLEPGDSIQWMWTNTANPRYTSIYDYDSINLNNRYLKVWQYGSKQGSIVIEGIGFTNGPFEYYGCFEICYELTCLTEKGESIFPQSGVDCKLLTYSNSIEEKEAVFTVNPNPVKDFVEFTSTDKKIQKIEFYSTLGQLVACFYGENQTGLLCNLSGFRNGFYSYIIYYNKREQYSGSILKK